MLQIRLLMQDVLNYSFYVRYRRWMYFCPDGLCCPDANSRLGRQSVNTNEPLLAMGLGGSRFAREGGQEINTVDTTRVGPRDPVGRFG